jgi:hypothetical protein
MNDIETQRQTARKFKIGKLWKIFQEDKTKQNQCRTGLGQTP